MLKGVKAKLLQFDLIKKKKKNAHRRNLNETHYKYTDDLFFILFTIEKKKKENDWHKVNQNNIMKHFPIFQLSMTQEIFV